MHKNKKSNYLTQVIFIAISFVIFGFILLSLGGYASITKDKSVIYYTILIFLSQIVIFKFLLAILRERKIDKDGSLIMFLPLTIIFLGVFVTICQFAIIYEKLGIIYTDSNTIITSHDYLYFSLVSFTTLGYGDFHPTIYSRPYAAFEALIGYFMLAILVGTILQLYSNIRESKQEDKDS